MSLQRWREHVEQCPAEPGIYLMRDAAGAVVYVGKAANLRGRLRSYFASSGDDRPFVPLLAGLLGDIETVVVANEKEALLLENTLIKRHRPRFNVKLRDDKEFLRLRVDPRQQFPRVELVRHVHKDGARYFGPYTSARGVRQMLQLLNRHFKLRTCSDHVLTQRRRPCLQHEMGRCSAPCVGLVTAQRYAGEVEAALLFLAGRTSELVDGLRARMEAAALAQDYEEAARVRDQVRAVERAREEQSMVRSGERGDMDMHALARAGSVACVATLSVRRGRVCGSTSRILDEVPFPDEELLSQYIYQLYEHATDVPPDIWLPRELEDQAALSEWLAGVRGGPVRLRTPVRGEGRRLLELTERNARSDLETRLASGDSTRRGVLELTRLLDLPQAPRHMECVDISAFHGSEAVGSVVCFIDGQADKQRYRRFRIRTVEGSDDFGMLREVLHRRLKRGKQELPDLLVVDGGRGQLAVAEDVVASLGLGSALSLAGLAKARVAGLRKDGSGAVDHSEERVFLPGRPSPVELPRHSDARHLLERLRDEAHRFAVSFHRQRRNKGTVRSAIDSIPGVGAARRAALLQRFGSLPAIRAASADELARLPGIGPRLAERILRALGRDV